MASAAAEVGIVRDDNDTVFGLLHVKFDVINAGVNGFLKGRDSVFWCIFIIATVSNYADCAAVI